MKKYEVLEMWGSGNCYYFDTIEEAKAKAKDITEEPKWTAWELEQYKREGENYVSIFEIEINADGYEDAYKEVETFVINETTLSEFMRGKTMKENLKEQFEKSAKFYKRLAQWAKQDAEQLPKGSKMQKERILAAEYNLGRAAAFREALEFVEEIIG